MRSFYLVPGISARHLKATTGQEAYDTEEGALMMVPAAISLDVAMRRLHRRYHQVECTCGAYAVVHGDTCPVGKLIG